jgi:hypothetical protein
LQQALNNKQRQQAGNQPSGIELGKQLATEARFGCGARYGVKNRRGRYVRPFSFTNRSLAASPIRCLAPSLIR